MATRSLIGYMDGDVCFYAYCHFDGHYNDTGRILFDQFSTFERVKQLVDAGDMSSVGDHFNDTINIKQVNSFDEFLNRTIEHWADFYYIFKDGVWYAGSTYPNQPEYASLVELSIVLDLYAY